MHEYFADVGVELERGVNHNAKVTHFAHSVNGLAINTVMDITCVHITQYNAALLSYRYR